MARETRLESPTRADPERLPGSPAPPEPSALVAAACVASPTARQASLAWRLSLLPARGATETLPEAETSEAAVGHAARRLDVDEKRLRRAKTDADALLRETKNASSVTFERVEPLAASRVVSSRLDFPSAKPSLAVTAYKTDAAIASWMEKRKQKERGRLLLRVRRARRDLDWILTRRKAQIAVCRREVKNDKADQALRAKAKREELEKLAVAPPAERREQSADGPPRRSASLDEKRDVSRASRDEKKNAREDREDRAASAKVRAASASLGDSDTRGIRRNASVAPASAHRRGSLAHVSRRGSVRELCHKKPFGRRTLFGSDAYAGSDDEDEARGRARTRGQSSSASRRAARTSSPERAVRVETKSVWVGPGQFVSARVEMPPAALTKKTRLTGC